MKTILLIFCFTLIVGCSTAKMLKSEEGRKLLIDSPEIQKIIKLKLVERTEKWCALDPLLRFAVRMELTAQRTHIPILSDEDSCDK